MDSNVGQIAVSTAERIFSQTVTRQSLDSAAEGDWLADLWQVISDNGLPLALVDEASGGFGLDIDHGLMIVRLAGRYAVPLPLAETMAANHLLARCGLEPAEGPLSMIVSGPAAPLALTRKDDTTWHVEGQGAHVPWPDHAESVVAHAHLDGANHLVRLPHGAWSIAETFTSTADHPAARVTIDTDLAAENVAPIPADLGPDPVMLAGAAIRTIAMAGAAQKVFDLTSEYATTRKQFGRPLSRFQVIQHDLARMASAVAVTSACADMAAAGFSTPDGAATIAAAKARTGEAVGLIAGLAHQIHGAIGASQEYELQHFTRLLWSLRDDFGTERHWQARLATLALDHADQGPWAFITGMEPVREAV